MVQSELHPDDNQAALGAELDGKTGPSDGVLFVKSLLDANPWAEGLTIDEENQEFLAQRKLANVDRFKEGRKAWNAWASKMELLCQQLKSNDLWDTVDKTGYWAARLGEPAATEAENEVTRLWLLLSVADFSGHTFDNAEIFVRFNFPGSANFDTAVFPDGANFAGALFHDNARFASTSFLGGGVSFNEAEFVEEAFFPNAVFDFEAEFVSTRFKGMATFDSSRFLGFSVFADSIFSETASFSAAEFKDDAIFDRAAFEGICLFERTVFDGIGQFDGTVFKSRCYFYSTKFKAGGSFIGAAFQENAFFSAPPEEVERADAPQFIGAMSFSRASFEKYVTFAGGIFYDEADFSAIQSKSTFSITSASFQRIPDFTQADFKQAPQLDLTRFGLKYVGTARWPFQRGPLPEKDSSELALRRDDPGRFRALRRLAIQGHDHDRELEFFAGEIKARRGIFDKALGPNTGAYWFGILYQATSDFGRSLVRPLMWWLGSAVLFASLYWLFRVNGQIQELCSPVLAASYVSFRKSFALVNLDTSDKLHNAYACLFGNDAKLIGHLTSFPGIPNAVEVVMIVQTVISGLLFFLLALALRNRFRIR